MAFISQSPKLDTDRLPPCSMNNHAEEKVSPALQPSRELEDQIDAFEALRHSFRPKDDFSENMQTLVKNMAEPMIRNWLEKHMMGIVESLVRTEIERVTRDTSSS